MGRGDDLFATFEAIHAAGLEPERWPQALGTMLGIAGGTAATLETIDRRTFHPREFYSFGIPPVQELKYIDEYAPLNVRLPFHASARPGEILWDYKVLDETTINRAPFYAEFLGPIGFRCFLSGVLDAPDGEFALVGLHRSRKQGHASRADIDVMRRLVPHVRQAFDVARRLRGAGETRNSLERALDWLADGVALVRADGAVVYANEAFQVIARRNDGIGIRRGRVEFTAGSVRARFDEAVGAAARLHAGETQRFGADFHVRRGSDAPPYLVSVRPLLDRKHAENGAVAIMFVRDPSSRNMAGLHMLREILGLTEAEAALAQAVQSGMSLADYAKADAISLNTVYTHLRRIKEKTGCHRMAELIRKLNDLQVPLRVV